MFWKFALITIVYVRFYYFYTNIRFFIWNFVFFRPPDHIRARKTLLMRQLEIIGRNQKIWTIVIWKEHDEEGWTTPGSY
jgi:hypothetical protein